MTTIHTLVLVIHVIIGVMMIGLILVQRGKGADAGAAFGAGASATVFGAKGSANFLSRSTAILATMFFATSLGLAYLGAQRPVVRSIIDEAPAQGAPAAGVAPIGTNVEQKDSGPAPNEPSPVGPAGGDTAGKSP